MALKIIFLKIYIGILFFSTLIDSVMTTLCFNSVENDPFIVKGLSVEEQRLQQIIFQIRDYGVQEKYIFKVRRKNDI